MARLVNSVGALLLSKGILKQDDLDVFVYGLDTILFSLVSIFSLLALGMITRLFVETLLCMLAFIPLQTTGGGYHAKTHFRCYLTTVAGWAIAMLLNRILPIWATALFMLQGYVAVFRYAPIEHANAPMSAGHKQKMRACARRVCIALSFTAIVMYALRPDLSIVLATSIGVYGISANVAYLLK